MNMYEITILSIVLGLLAFAIILMSIQAVVYKRRTKMTELTDRITGQYTKDGIIYKIKKLKTKNYISVIKFDLVDSHSVEAKIGNDKYKDLILDITNYLKDNLEEGSLIGHYNFDCFLLCTYETDVAIIISFLEGLQVYLNEHYENYLNLELISGFAVDVPCQETINKCVSAWKYAKRNKERIVIYDEKIYKIEEKFNQLLDNPSLINKEFTVYYQPKVNATTGEIQGAEALARWIDDKGNISMRPTEFVKEFESNGLITNLDFFVLEEVCKLLESFKKRGEKEIVISLNFSREDFKNPNLIEDVNTIINKYQFDRKYLHIEVTESAYVSTEDGITDSLLKLKELGIAAEMDDFGSGYSSIGSLVNLKCDVVKMDRLFVENKLRLKSEHVLIESLIKMFIGVGLKVVVEGVESAYVVKEIRKIAPDVLIQGYYFFKPMPLVKLERILMDSRYVLDDVFKTSVNYNKTTEAKEAVKENKYEDNKNITIQIEQVKPDNNDDEKYKKLVEDAENEKNMIKKALDEALLEQEALIKAQQSELNIKDEEYNNALKESEEKNKKIIEELEALKNELEKAKLENQSLIEESENAKKLADEEALKRQQAENEAERIAAIKESEEKNKKIIEELEALKNELEKAKLENQSLIEESENAKKLADEEALKRQQAESEAERIAALNEQLEQDALEKRQENLVNRVEEIDIDDSDYDDEDDTEDEMINQIIEEYKKKYQNEWEQEMLKKYPDLLKKSRERKTFVEKICSLETKHKDNYNTIKNELMKYMFKNRITKYFDTFVFKNTVVCKIAVVGKSLRLYLALNPNDYPEGQFPHKDVSNKKRHEKTPYLMKISSPLSVKRAIRLIDDLVKINNIESSPDFKEKNYVKIIQLTANRNK